MKEHLVRHPDAGAVIRGTGGITKLRWRGEGHGKRGGARFIYYRAIAEDRILMLFMYLKNEKDGISSQERKTLRGIVKQEDK